MTRHPLALAPVLSIALLAHTTGVVNAEFSLAPETTRNSGAIFELTYRASGTFQADDALIDRSALAEFDELLAPDWQPAPTTREATSALIAIDADRAGARWGLSVAGGDALAPEAFALRPVQIGTWSALQVTARVDLVPEGEWQLVITAPGQADSARDSRSVDRVSPDEDWLTNGLFLNGSQSFIDATNAGSQPGAIRSTAGSSTPAPPGSHRARYREGLKVATVDVLDPAGIDSMAVLHHGRELAMLPWNDGASALVVLPERTNILTDRHDVVFLGEDQDGGGARIMAQRDAFPSSYPQGEEVALLRSKLHAPRLVYERATPLEIGDRFVQYRINRTQTRTSNYPLYDRLADDSITARVKVPAMTTNDAFDPDHYAEFSVGGVWDAGVVSWKGRTVLDHAFSVVINAGDYPGSANQTIPFQHRVPAVAGGPPADTQTLLSVELEWTGYPRVGPHHRLVLDVPAPPDEGQRNVTVGGFPAGTTADDLFVFDITHEAWPVMITGPSIFTDASGTVAVEWEADADGGRYLVQLREDVLPLDWSPTATLPELPTMHLRGIYVSPPELRDSLQPLVDHRGEGYIVLDPNAAYDIYSNGQESPEAIRLAIRHLMEHATYRVAFPTVVLVGHGSLDPRDYLGQMNAPQVPVFVEESVDTGFTIENSVDFPYGLLFGDDDFIDAQVSRLPAKSAGELDVMVARILAFEESADELEQVDRPAVFLYDNDTGFMLDAPVWAELWSETGRPLDEIALAPGSNGNAEKAQFLAALQQDPNGPVFVMYTGHGNNNIWASQGLLRTTDIPALDTKGGYPFVTTFTCLNAYFAFPGAANPSMAEQWLLVGSTQGAGATYAPSSVDFYFAQRVKQRAFLELLALTERPRFSGQLITRARLQFAAERPDLMLTNTEYLFFGDPMTPITLETELPLSVEDWMSH